MYYFLRQNLFDAQDIIEIEGHTSDTGQRNWISGFPFSQPLAVQNLILDSSYGSQLADFFDTTVPVMSSRLLNFLVSLGVDNIDKYPVVLNNKDQKIDGYFAINVIGCLDVADLDNSEYEMDDDFDEPDFTGKIAIDETKAKDAMLFRMPYGPGFIVVSQKIADALKTQPWKAVLLQPTTDYNGI